jgi:glycosyltransferase involved in cell wall biosynthesis
VNKGWHKVAFPLPRPETINKVRIDPGNEPGRYILAEFAVYMTDQRTLTQPRVDCLEPSVFTVPPQEDRYATWLRFNRWSRRLEEYLTKKLENSSGKLPKISVVVPVYNPPLKFLKLAIESVLNQIYSNWQLCISDDCSTSLEVKRYLDALSRTDQRIRVVFRESNGGISAASNSAAELATGEFLAFLDHDDELHRDALAEIAILVADDPTIDVVYTDEDKIDIRGRRYDPNFKPNWSPELLMATNYINHLSVVRKSLFDEIGGFRPATDCCQDHDMLLRATEHANKIVHLPTVAYHWRALPGSGAARGDTKFESFEAELRAVRDALNRRQIQGLPSVPEWARQGGYVLNEIAFPDDGPSVTILVPTKDNLRNIQKCLESLERTTYQNFEIFIIDNESSRQETKSFLTLQSNRVIRIGNPSGTFNFAYINNQAVRKITSEYIVFLNDDVEVSNIRWLSQMMGYAQIPGVGAVGAKLLYPDRNIQHAGVVHGVHKGVYPDHALRGFADNHLAYMLSNRLTRNCSAVTAACMLTPTRLFLETGGFDDQNFGVQYNDIDYCYRLQKKGYRIVQCNDAVLIHHESASRGHTGQNLEENLAYLEKYGDFVDSYYNPNLSLHPMPNFQTRPRRMITGKLKPVRTLFFTHNLNFEGAPYVFQELVTSLATQKVVDPVVCSLIDGPMRSKFEAENIPVLLLQQDVTTNGDFEPWVSTFKDIVASNNVEVVLANTVLNWPSISASQMLGVPTVWNLHESEGFEACFGPFGTSRAEKAIKCFTSPYRVIFGSFATMQRWQHLGVKNNFDVIHNVLEPSRLEAMQAVWPRHEARASLGLEDHHVAVLLMGTLCERKGQLDLVRAIDAMSSESRQRVKCFLVGDWLCDYSQTVHEFISSSSKGLRETIQVVPITSDIHKYYSSADIAVCTSRMECFPRVILEYMAYGLPLVTTLAYGIAEQVFPGVNALTYEPGDVGTLASHLKALIEDNDLRRKLAANSRRVFNALNDFDGMLDKYSEVIREAYLGGGNIKEKDASHTP